jgi:hypothetical protein
MPDVVEPSKTVEPSRVDVEAARKLAARVAAADAAIARLEEVEKLMTEHPPAGEAD